MNNYLKQIVGKCSPETRACLDDAINHALTRTHHEVELEHLLLALITRQTVLMETLRLNANLNTERLLSATHFSLNTLTRGNFNPPVFSPVLVQWLEKAALYASTVWSLHQCQPRALLACLLRENVINGITSDLRSALFCNTEAAQQILDNADLTLLPEDEKINKTKESKLTQYTQNLTQLAREGKLDNVVGREGEIRQMVDILLRRRQNNPILTGEAGVGKTALVEGLAQRIASGNVPNKMKNMEVLTLDLGLLQAGASIKGEFENRLKALITEIQNAPQEIILFVDEAHTLIGAGGQAGQNDAANLLKPALARGELRMVAATTWSEYKKYFEKDAALTRRFQVVTVSEPDQENAVLMLRAVAKNMSLHHGVPILDSAIRAAVTLSARYITGRQLPDKAINLLDTACARVAVSQASDPKQIEDILVKLNNLRNERTALQEEGSYESRIVQLDNIESELNDALQRLRPQFDQQKNLVQQLQESRHLQEIVSLRNLLAEHHRQNAMVFDCVDTTCVADVLSGWTRVPLGRVLEKENFVLHKLLPQLKQRIIGQDDALATLTSQIKINRANLNVPNRPAGVFMLAGPSGVGKTETALALSDLLFGDKASLVTINLSEYQEAHSISGLRGAPPGYVGFGQGGVLTEAIKRTPYCVLLLDEVEKAHPDVLKFFYQIFDKGMIEDAEGQAINFRNTMIIMTTNLGGTSIISATSESDCSGEILCSLIWPELENHFQPAMMGRIIVLPYRPLHATSLESIIKIKLERICQQYQASRPNCQLSYHNQVISWVAQHCRFIQTGARDIDKALNQHVLPPLADSIFCNDDNFTGSVKLNVRNNHLILSTQKCKKKQP